MANLYDAAFGSSSTPSAPSGGSGSPYDAAFGTPSAPTATASAAPKDLTAGLPQPIKIPTLQQVQGDRAGAQSQLTGLTDMLNALDSTLKTKPTNPAGITAYNAKVQHYNDVFDAYTKLHGYITTPLSPEEIAKENADFKASADKNAGTFNIIKNTITGLPKAAWNFLGVGKIQDVLATPEGQEAALNLTGGDVAKAVIPSVGKTLGAPAADIAGIFTGPKTYHVPLVGDITNIQQQTKDAVMAGENPYVAIIQAAPQSIFDGLFVAGMAEKVFSPRETTIARGVKVPENTIADTGDQSFRLTQPVKSTSQPIPNEALTELQNSGVRLRGFDPKNPSFFKVTPMADGTLKGQIVQLKPSILDTFRKALGGDIYKVPNSETTVVYEETKSPQEIKQALTEPQAAPAEAPAPEGAPIVPEGQPAPTEAPAAQATAPNTPTVAELENLVKQIQKKPTAEAAAAANAYKPARTVPVKQIYGNKPEDKFITGTFEGKPYTTNSYIMEFDSKVPAPEKANAIGGKEAPNEQAVRSIIPEGGVPVTPKSVKVSDEKNNIELDGKDITTHVQQKYYDYFSKKYPGAQFIAAGPAKPIKVMVDGALKGLLMPMEAPAKFTTLWQRAEAAAKENPKDLAEKMAKDLKPMNEIAGALYQGDFGLSQKEATKMAEEAITVKPTKSEVSLPAADESKQIIDTYIEGHGYPSERGFEHWLEVNHPSADTEALMTAYKAAHPDIAAEEEKPALETEGGFISPAAVTEDIKKVVAKTKEYIEQSNKAVAFSSELNDTLYKAIKNAEADFIQSDKLLEATKDIPKDVRSNIDEYRDALGAGLDPKELTEKEQSINDNILEPLARDLEEKRAFIKKYGVSLPSEDTNPRLVKGKGSTIDKLVAEKDKFVKRATMRPTKNILRKSAPTLKSRTMFAATNDETGERTVVHIEKKNVTQLKNNVAKHLGSTEQIVSPKIKEFYDERVTPVLEKLARDLGITHEVKKQGGNRAGFSVKGKPYIETHPGAPERVLLHEIGHQIDERYGLSELIPDTKLYNDQLRAVADLRAEGKNVTKGFKSYLRSTPEKMAAMFEAYLHVPNKFEEVAPQVFYAFESFLGRHPELKPILDLDPSIVLGMKKSGGEHLAGMKGKQFVAEDGTKYTIGEATKAEIEANTNVRYYHDPITAMVFTHQDITQVYRAVQILDSFKNSPEFQDIAFKIGDGIAPAGWKVVNLPQFRDYLFEPRTADVLNAFAMDIKSGEDPVRYLTAINNLLTSTMFMSPVKHLMNVGTSAIINRGLTRWLNPLAYPVAGRAMIQGIRSVVTQDEDYIKILRSGGPMMSAKVDQDVYRANVLANLGEAGDEYAKIFNKTKRIVGAVTPWHWAHALTWPGNDMIIQQQLREELAKQGLTVKTATEAQIEDTFKKNVLKMLPDYRLPVAVRKVPKYVTRNTVLFAAYRFSLLKSFFELGKTVITGDDPNWGGQEAWKNRAKAFDKIAIMALLAAIVMPYIDKELKKLTGNPNAYLSDPSQLSTIDNVNKLLTNQIDPGQYVQTMFDLPPGTKEVLQQIVNLDFFTGKAIRPAVGPLSAKFGASLTHLETTITPFDLVQRVSGGTMTLKQLLEAQIGVHTPKGNPLLNILAGSNASILQEVKRLNDAGTPPSSTDIQKSPEMQILKAEVPPAKYQEALDQFTGAYVANIAKLLDGTYVHHSATTFPKTIDYKNLTDSEKATAFSTVKTDTLKTVLQAYGYNKSAATLTSKAEWNDVASKLGDPTTSNLSEAHPDDGAVEKKNPKGEPYYTRFPVSVSNPIRDQLYNGDPYWKDNGYTENDVQLDHIVPVEAGGTMTKDNLMLISKTADQLNQAFEDYVGEKYKDGTITRADAIRASIDYKIKKSVTMTDIKNGKY